MNADFAITFRYISDKLKYFTPRIVVTFAVFVLLFSNVRDGSALISIIDFGYGSLNYNASLIIASTMMIALIWISYGILVSVASSLGFKAEGERDFVVTGNGNIINVSKSGRKNTKNETIEADFKIEEYREGRPLVAMRQGRSRIFLHIERLQNSSIVNLFLGVGIAFIGILILGSTFFEVEKYADKSAGLNASGFLLFALLPRLSIALIVQVFSFFFLMMYRSNIHDVRYFQNEISNIDFISAAISMCPSDNDAISKGIISSLLKTERNKIALKNQKFINPANDDDIMQKLANIEEKISRIDYSNPKKSDGEA